MAFRFSGRHPGRPLEIQARPGAVHVNRGQAAPAQSSVMTGAAAMVSAWAEQKAAENRREKDQREILQGMSMAAQGMAIDEVGREESWYNRIFGKTNLVDGARAYHSANAGNRVLQDINDHMPMLAQMSPEQAREMIHERIKHGAQTGDAGLDFQIQQQVLERIPQILKTQAKLNYEWQQENMSLKQREFIASEADVAGQTLHMMSRDPDTKAEDIAAVVQRFQEGLMPADGQDREAWSKNITEMMLMHANMAGRPRKITQEDGSVIEVPGNLYTLEAFRASGVIDALEPDNAARVIRAFETAEQTARKRYADAYADPLATLYAKAGQPVEGVTAQQLRDEITALNRRYMQETGSTIPLIDSDQTRAIMTRNIDAITRENERRADKAFQIREREIAAAERRREKAAAEHARKMADLERSAFVIQNGGQISRYIARGAVKDAEVQKEMSERIDAAPDFQTRLAEMARWDVIHKGTQHDIQRSVQAMVDNPAIVQKSPDTAMEQVQRFLAMKQVMGESKTADYYGDHYKFMTNYANTMKTVGSPAAAWEIATNDVMQTFGTRSDAMKAADEIIKDNTAGAIADFFGFGGDFERGLSGTNRSVIKGALAIEYEKALRRTGDENTARATALERVKDRDTGAVQMFGDMAVPTPSNGATQRLDQWLMYPKTRSGNAAKARNPVERDRLGDAMKEAVRLKMYGENGKGAAIDNTVNWIFDNEAANTQMIQTTLDGEPVLHVSGIDQDDRPFSFALKASEILDANEKARAKRLKQNSVSGNIEALSKTVDDIKGAAGRVADRVMTWLE